MKTGAYLLLLIASFQIAKAQTAAKPLSVRFDGIYECKEWVLVDNKVDDPSPAYFRFFPDSVLLFCCYKDPKDKDSSSTPQSVFQTVLTSESVDKIKDNAGDDPTNVYRNYKKFRITAYKYQKHNGGICYDILTERPNCLGKPNIKLVSSDVIKALSQSGDPIDNRLFKFVQVN